MTEDEHRHRRFGRELVEPRELAGVDGAAIDAGNDRVEHRERDAVELDR